MIISTRMLNMRSGSVSAPPAFKPLAECDTDWFFAPHMYGNPYQDILYGAMGQQGIHTRGRRSIGEAVDAAIASKAPHRVLHFHWLNVVLAGAKDAAEEDRRIEVFQGQLQRLTAAGVKIGWTIHNVLPHEGYSEASAIRVRELIVQAADFIHVMAPDTRERCAPVFEVPEAKLLRVEHPGYHGFYPAVRSGDLRQRWGLAAGGKLAVILGGIKPYKGLNEFAAEFSQVTSSRPRDLALLIAGKPSGDFENSPLAQAAELSTNLHVLPETVSDAQVSELMTLADFVVIPYQASLNSGAMVLALTYCKPVLARSSAGSTHLLSSGAGFVYDHESELDGVLRNLDWLPAATQRAAEMSEQLDRQRLTEVFAHAARAFLDGGVESARSVAGANGGLNG